MTKKKTHPKRDNPFVVSLTLQTKHLIGMDAGSSKELNDRKTSTQINRRRFRSEENFKKAQKSYACSNLNRAREHMKLALEYGAKAYWWSETTPHQEENHHYIHRIAKWNHDKLCCFIEYENGKYVQRCMIAYSHKRLGISPGMYGDKICSICDQDLSMCSHKINRTYWIRGGSRNDEKECRICLKKACSHNSRYLYRTTVVARMKNSVLEEVSLVRYPVQPEMRVISEFTYSIAEIMHFSKYRLIPGERVLCHACKGECPGFSELELT